jgi:hypothetical protein
MSASMFFFHVEAKYKNNISKVELEWEFFLVWPIRFWISQTHFYSW